MQPRPPGRLLFKPVRDCNLLLLPALEPAAPQAAPSAAALCPLPDMVAVIASGLRRGLVAPVDLVELKDCMRASAAEDMHTSAFAGRLLMPSRIQLLQSALTASVTWAVATGDEQPAEACNLGAGGDEEPDAVPAWPYRPCDRHHVRFQSA